MYARLLAFACLLSCSGLIVRAEPTLAPVATVGVYLKGDANASSISLQSMRVELRDLMAPTDLNLVWTNARGTTRVDRLIVVDLRGTCQAGTENVSKFKDHSALASTAVTDGKVLPFSWVDCTALDQFLRPALANRSPLERDVIYGRAMARLLAHEFYHVLAQTEAHTSSGVSKTSFSIADLMADYFTFQPDAVALLQGEQALPTLAAAATHAEDTEVALGLPKDVVSEAAFAAR